MQLYKGKCNVLHLGRNKSRHQYTLRADRLERRPWKVLMDNKLTMRQQCAPTTKAANSLLGCIKKSSAGRSRETHLACWIQCWAPKYRRDMDIMD